jgi:hypothetical protein
MRVFCKRFSIAGEWLLACSCLLDSLCNKKHAAPQHLPKALSQLISSLS